MAPAEAGRHIVTRKADAVERKIRNDVEVLVSFISLYCNEKHGPVERGPVRARGRVGDFLGDEEILLCEECRSLLLHAVSKRIICPHDPKPACKKCPDHCYEPRYREMIREVMKYSGMRMIRKGRVDLLKKYFF